MAFNGCFSLKYPGNPQPGDLIEVFRPGYQHWALYLGDGYVINIAPLEEVMQRSEFVIGQEVEYDVLVNNCEHFVTLLRYGEGVSEQANRAISTIGFVTAAASAFSFLGLFSKRQKAKYY